MDTTAGLAAVAVVEQPGGWDPAVVSVVGAVLVAVIAGLASWVTSRVAARASRENTIMAWAKTVRESEEAARRAEEAARRSQEETQQKLDKLRDQMDDLEDKLRAAQHMVADMTDKLLMVQTEVWRPEPDVAALRRLVGRPAAGGLNGRP